jgi:lipopolysaccharide/colanic/teichoic acid biosynthesis glycosyltransferase
MSTASPQTRDYVQTARLQMLPMSTRGQLDPLIRRERARSDRTGLPFSLVTFRGPINATTDTALKPVEEVAAGRMRETDERGWFDDQTFYTVMFDTNGQGARKFAEDVADSVAKIAPRPSFTIYSYPSNRDIGDTVRKDSDGHEVPHDIIERYLLAGMSVELHAPGSQPQHIEAALSHPMPRWKRAMDIAGASVGLVMLSPLMLIVALLIKLTSRGPIIFSQQRSGLAGKPFTLYKFRTMAVDAEQRKQELMDQNEQDGPAFKIKRDPRVTPIGRFLRKSSLDELPQLWNVLTGDMTIVGPRPLPCDETEATDQWHRKRLDVTPGLTCIWQVYGRSRVSFDEWVRMDMRYILRRNILHDLKLIFLTVPALLWRRNGH